MGLKLALRANALAGRCGWLKVLEVCKHLLSDAGSPMCFLSPEVPLGILEGGQDRAFVSLTRLSLKMQMVLREVKLLLSWFFKTDDSLS